VSSTEELELGEDDSVLGEGDSVLGEGDSVLGDPQLVRVAKRLRLDIFV